MLCEVMQMISGDFIACFSNFGFKLLRITKLAASYLSFHNYLELFNRIKLRGVQRKVNTLVTSDFDQLDELTVFPANRGVTMVV